MTRDTIAAFETIPDVLRDWDNWILWTTTQRDGKETKLPINPETKRPASSTNRETWSSYRTAVNALGHDYGLGFVFSPDDLFIGIDLDNVYDPERDALEPIAQTLLTRLDSYTEYSPSRTGFHVFILGSYPSDATHRGDLPQTHPDLDGVFGDPTDHDGGPHLEAYHEKRFFTMTGDHYEPSPRTIEPRQTTFDTIAETFLADDTTATGTGDGTAPAPTPPDPDDYDPADDDTIDPGVEVDLTDAEIRRLASEASNGQKFTRLWRGNIAGYPSQSEADLALCMLLAFWTQKDPRQMDSLFRDSGLMRPKWDEDRGERTYGQRTIAQALARQHEVYDPAPRDSEADDGSGS